MTSLARMVMEGTHQLGGTTSSVDLSGFDYSKSALMESSYLDSACATLFAEIMESDQRAMVADVIVGANNLKAIQEGTTYNAQAAMEGFFSDLIDKIINSLKSFWAKVKEFFKKVIEWFRAMFSNAEEFAKRYGKELVDKANKQKGFKYEGFKYTQSEGDKLVGEFIDKIDSAITDKIFGAFDRVYTKDGTVSSSGKSENLGSRKDGSNAVSLDDARGAAVDYLAQAFTPGFKEDGKPSSSDIIDGFLSKDLKVEDQSDMVKSIRDKYRDNEDTKTTIVDFEANSVSSMVEFLKNSSKAISDIQKAEKTLENPIEQMIKKLNGFKSKETGEAASAQTSQLSYAAGIGSAFLNLMKSCFTAKIDAYKEMSSTWLGVLKRFYNYRGVKESVVVFDPEAYAALENSIIFESDEPETGDDDGGDKKGNDKGSDDSGEDKENKEDKEKPTEESAVAALLEAVNNFRI